MLTVHPSLLPSVSQPLPSHEQMWMDGSPARGGARSPSPPKSCLKVGLPPPPPWQPTTSESTAHQYKCSQRGSVEPSFPDDDLITETNISRFCEDSLEASSQVTAYRNMKRKRISIISLSMFRASLFFTSSLLPVRVQRGKRRGGKLGNGNVIGIAAVSTRSHCQGSSRCSSQRTGCQISGPRPPADRTSPCGRKTCVSSSRAPREKWT